MNRLLLLIALLFAATNVLGQDQKEVRIESESFEARQVDGMTVIELLRPILTHEDTRLTAQNGVDEGNGYVRFWGNVEIVEKEDTIRAERIRYHKDTKVATVNGNVRMTDGEAFLEAPSAVHYSDRDSTLFSDGVSYSDSLTALTADRATYLSETNMAYFSSRVTLTQEDARVYADSLAYDREAETSWAWTRILIEQSADSTSTFMMADRMIRLASQDSVRLWGNGLMATIDHTEQDTVFVSAPSFWLTEQDSVSTMSASDSVLVSAPGYALRTDSLVTVQYEDEVRINRLFGSPFTWLDETQVNADSLTLTAFPAAPDSVFGSGNVFIARLDSSTTRIQQLKSTSFNALVADDSLKLVMRGNAEGLLYVRDSEQGDIKALRISGDWSRFTFQGEELTDVGFFDGLEGTYYPENLFDQLSNLAGYIWVPEQRPDRALLSSRFWEEAELRRRHGME